MQYFLLLLLVCFNEMVNESPPRVDFSWFSFTYDKVSYLERASLEKSLYPLTSLNVRLTTLPPPSTCWTPAEAQIRRTVHSR